MTVLHTCARTECQDLNITEQHGIPLPRRMENLIFQQPQLQYD